MDKNQYLKFQLTKHIAEVIWVDGWRPTLSFVEDEYFVCSQDEEERFFSFDAIKSIKQKDGHLMVFIDEPVN